LSVGEIPALDRRDVAQALIEVGAARDGVLEVDALESGAFEGYSPDVRSFVVRIGLFFGYQ